MEIGGVHCTISTTAANSMQTHLSKKCFEENKAHRHGSDMIKATSYDFGLETKVEFTNQ